MRLTRSGLSIVEWNVITGVIPPLNEADWQSEFDKYKQSPEYQKINFDMPLEEFKFIYHMEFWHRFLGRIAGLSFVLPLLYFLRRGVIPRTSVPIYIGIGLLFALQGLIGWLMVKSGLDDRPSVSHIRLTFHLSGALILLATCLWQAFKHIIPHERKAHSTPLALPSVLFFAALYIQIAAGGLLAGLKAGHISDVSPHVRSADSGRVVQLNAGLDQPTRQRTHGAFPTPMVCFHRTRASSLALFPRAGAQCGSPTPDQRRRPSWGLHSYRSCWASPPWSAACPLRSHPSIRLRPLRSLVRVC